LASQHVVFDCSAANQEQAHTIRGHIVSAEIYSLCCLFDENIAIFFALTAPICNRYYGSELEKKLAEATSNKPWGASGTELQSISEATYD
jgi:hypothetical protein